MTDDERMEKLEEAHRLFNAEEFDESAEVLKEILAYEIKDAPALQLLGQISEKRSNYDVARDLYKESLRLDPEQSLTWAQLGSVLGSLRDDEGAEKALEKALEINPKMARAYKYFADIYLNQGEIEKGLEYLDKAIEANPGFLGSYLPYTMNANLPVDHPVVRKIIRTLEENKDNKASNSNLHYTLSYVYQKLGDTQKYFEHLHLANEKAANSDDKWRGNLDVNLDRIKSVMTPEFLAKKVSEDKKLYTPIFIVGMPRSGTSLTDQIFATHSQCFGGDELQYFSKYMERINKGVGEENGVKSWPSWTMENLEMLANLYQQRVQQIAPGYQYISDKMPWNYRQIGMISKALPWAKIIHIYRDPLDCGYSCYRSPLSKNIEFSSGLEDYAHYRANYQQMMDFWKETIPDAYIDLSYEELVKDPENQIRRILEYCGLPWEDGLLEFHKTKRQVRTISSNQVSRPLYTSSIGKAWKYKDELAPMIKALEGHGLLNQ